MSFARAWLYSTMVSRSVTARSKSMNHAECSSWQWPLILILWYRTRWALGRKKVDTRQRLQREVGSSSVYWMMASAISWGTRILEVEDHLWLCDWVRGWWLLRLAIIHSHGMTSNTFPTNFIILSSWAIVVRTNANRGNARPHWYWRKFTAAFRTIVSHISNFPHTMSSAATTFRNIEYWISTIFDGCLGFHVGRSAFAFLVMPVVKLDLYNISYLDILQTACHFSTFQ